MDAAEAARQRDAQAAADVEAGRAEAARERSLRAVTIAHGQLLCAILVPGPMNNSVWGKVVPTPKGLVGVGAAAERRPGGARWATRGGAGARWAAAERRSGGALGSSGSA